MMYHVVSQCISLWQVISLPTCYQTCIQSCTVCNIFNITRNKMKRSWSTDQNVSNISNILHALFTLHFSFVCLKFKCNTTAVFLIKPIPPRRYFFMNIYVNIQHGYGFTIIILGSSAFSLHLAELYMHNSNHISHFEVYINITKS